MASKCEINDNNLKRSIRKAFPADKIKLEENENLFAEELKSTCQKDSLKDSHLFIKQALEEYIEYRMTGFLMVDDNKSPLYYLFVELKKNLDKFISNAINLALGINNVSDDISPDKDGGQFDIALQVEFIALNELYGSAQQARTDMLRMLRSNLIASAVVDFRKGTIVRSNVDFNDNIVNFHRELAKAILDYAKNLGEPDLNILLYDDKGNYIKGSFEKLREIAIKIFDGFNPTKLNRLYETKNTSMRSSQALYAYNSWVILNNFDMLVKNLLGRSIEINGTMQGFVNSSDNKYTFSKKSNLIKTWRTSENVNAIDELGNITKLLFEVTPMYDHNTGKKIPGMFLTDQQVLYAFSKVRQHPNLKLDAQNIRYCPMIYVPRLIDAALSTNYPEDSNNIKNILYSVKLGFFKLSQNNQKDSEQENYSLVLVLNREMKEYGGNRVENLLSYITGMIDKTNPNLHLLYSVDQTSGFILPKFTSESSQESYKYVVQNNIVNINNALNEKSKKDLLATFELETDPDTPNSKHTLLITFNYGGKKYRYRFNNGFNSLAFKDFQVEKSGVYVTPDSNEDTRNALIYFLDLTLFLNLQNREDLLGSLFLDSSNKIETLCNLALLSGRVIVKHAYDGQSEQTIMAVYNIHEASNNKYWKGSSQSGIKPILNDNTSGVLLLQIAKALVITTGEIVKSTIRNLEGNQIATEGLTNYINNIKTIFTDAKMDSESAILDCIYAENPNLIKNIVLKTAAQNTDRTVTRANQDWNVKEIGYSSVMLDFLPGFAFNVKPNTFETNQRDMLFTPTTPSDKKNNPMLSIDKSVLINIPGTGKGKTVLYLSAKETHDIHFNRMLSMYNKLRKTLVNDYNVFLSKLAKDINKSTFTYMTTELSEKLGRKVDLQNPDLTFEEVKTGLFPVLNNMAEAVYKNGKKIFFGGKSAVQIFHQYAPYSVEEMHHAFDAKSGGKKLYVNPVLDFYFLMYNNREIYDKVMHKNEQKFARTCIKNFNVDWSSTFDGKENELLVGAVAKLLHNGDLEQFGSFDGYTDENGVPVGPKENVEGNTDFFKRVLKSFKNSWVDPYTEEMAIARIKDENGNWKLIFKQDVDLIKPSYNNTNFELNPIFKVFFAYDNMYSQLFITTTAGGCYLHADLLNNPIEFQSNYEIGTQKYEEDLLTYYERCEGGRLLTLYKRMVIYPATMHNYQLGLLEGCASEYNVALFKARKAKVYNYTNGSKSIKALDGAGFVVPSVSYYENKSLGDAAVGHDKKTIGYNVNQKYMTGTEFKWALYELTNERIRYSGVIIDGGDNISLKHIMKKAQNYKWDINDLDITKPWYGESGDINIGNLTSECQTRGIYFKATDQFTLIDENDLAKGINEIKPGSYYQITNFSKVGTSLYEFTLQEVTKAGDVIPNSEIKVQKVIDNNYSLWQAFGAEYSMELTEDNGLIGSENSNRIQAYFGNNVGVIRSQESAEYGTLMRDDLVKLPGIRREKYRTNDDILDSSKRAIVTQRDVYQPIKYSGISYLVDDTAVKNGQINVNPTESWTDNSLLKTFKISTKHFGVLMDPDHEADEAELSEMTQVISALEANGYTHKYANLAYLDLGAIVYTQLKPYMQAISKYYENGDHKALYEVLGKAFLSSFKESQQNRIDLGDTLIKNLKIKLGKELSLVDNNIFIPFSDNSVLSKVVSTVTSAINNSAIKRKYSGIAAVLVPSYDMIKIYKDDKGKDCLFNKLVDDHGTPINAQNQLKARTLNGPEIYPKQLELGKSYIYEENGLIKRITLDDVNEYYAFRESNLTFKEDFEVGRNLQPARTNFKLLAADGTPTQDTYDIYDTAEVRNKFLFRDWFAGLRQATDKKAYLLSSEKELDKIISLSGHFTLDLQRLKESMYRASTDDRIDFFAKRIDVFLKEEIVKAFENLHNNGTVRLYQLDKTSTPKAITYKVDKTTIKLLEAEMVLSKIYATKFGLTAGMNLSDIDLNFFEKQIKDKMKTVENDTWDFALTNSNGKHVYITIKGNEGKRLAALTKVEPKTIPDYFNGLEYRIDLKTGKKTIPFTNCELYVDEAGNEIILTDNIAQFLNAKEYDSILINNLNDENNINKVFDILKKTKSNSKLLNKIHRYKDGISYNIDYFNKQSLLIRRLALEKYVSFQKSLEFTAARIPSQSMQSFMPMKIVGFTDSEENKVYVSHIQLFLQGSDYDIDKAFILGNEFTDDGKYIAWSPLFDFSSMEALHLSEELPMPTGKKIRIAMPDNPDTISGIDITDQVKELLKSNINNISRMKAWVAILEKLNDAPEGTVFYIRKVALLSGKLHFGTDKELQTLVSYVESRINKHQTYFDGKNDDLIIQMTKNSVSSKMRKIINHPSNMVLAYEPVELETARDASKRSSLGREEYDFTYSDPSVKWQMREQNMVGKTAIGITAVGEKVLFALQNYYNNLARLNSDDKKIRLMRALFHKTFLFKEKADEIVRNIIANVNISNKEDNEWVKYINNQLNLLNNLLQSKIITQETYDILSEMLLMQISVMADSALVNSSLLSAATDNAKELILSKINATPDFLKVYTYSIILGIDFNTIADFMTSSTISAIDELAKPNIFIANRSKSNTYTAMNFIENGIKMSQYGLEDIVTNIKIKGKEDYAGLIRLFEGTRDEKSIWAEILGYLSSDMSDKEFKLKLHDILLKVEEAENNFKKNYQSAYTHRRFLQVMRFLRDAKEVLSHISNINPKDYRLFKTLLQNAEEFNTLGRILAINQGINTVIDKKMTFLSNLESPLDRLLRAIGGKLDPITIKGILPLMSDTELNKLPEVRNKALQLGIIVLSEKGTFYSNLNPIKFILNEEYKQTVILLYDYVKATINVYDVIDVVPHFKAMLKACVTDFILFQENSSRFAFAYELQEKLGYPRLNANQRLLLRRQILNFLQDVSIGKYFKERNVKININDIHYDERMKPNMQKTSGTIDLSTTIGQANFKRWMEHTVIPRLKQGYDTSEGNTPRSALLSGNKFISDLILSGHTYTITRNIKTSYTLPIDMANTKSISDVNNFVMYLNAFTDLQGQMFDGIPVLRLFAFYNIITYKNLYGRDALTRIFENYMTEPGNEIQDFFDFIGNMDYNKLLVLDDFSLNDLQMACAVSVSRYDLRNKDTYFGPYVKVWNPNSNTYDIYKYDKYKGTRDSSYNAMNQASYLEEEYLLEIGEVAFMNDFEYDPELMGGYEEGVTSTEKYFDPKKYNPVETVNENKENLMMDFPFINIAKIFDESLKKDITNFLKTLFQEGKILLTNKCA